jgi:hypothetical protein
MLVELENGLVPKVMMDQLAQGGPVVLVVIQEKADSAVIVALVALVATAAKVTVALVVTADSAVIVAEVVFLAKRAFQDTVDIAATVGLVALVVPKVTP